MKIMAGVIQHDQYFLQRPDCTRANEHTPEMKITVALRMLAYGTPAQLNDNYLKIGETTSRATCMNFVMQSITSKKMITFGGHKCRYFQATE